MTQFDFEILLEKYIKGGCSPEEAILVETWSHNQIEKSENPLAQNEIERVKMDLWNRIKLNENTGLKKNPNASNNGTSLLKLFRKTNPRILAASIALVLLMALSYYLVDNKVFESKGPLSTQTGIMVSNTTNMAQIIDLKDGTKVTLKPKSSITYPEKFGEKNRTVYLTGEAFFEVKRDTTRPFLVYSGNLITEVLGTSFHIKSNKNSNTSEVIVVSGKVMVYSLEDENKIQNKSILTPNKRATFDKNSQEIAVDLVENPIIVNHPKKAKNFIFIEKPIVEVLAYLENVYSVPIESMPSLHDCVFSGDLNGLDFYTQIELVCMATNAHFEKKNTGIIITGQGCN